MKTRFLIAALLSGALFAPQALADPPSIFIYKLYILYYDKDPWAKGNDPCDEYCEADFARLIKTARRKHVIDYDPVCQCQHGGDRYMMFTGGAGATENDYRAVVKNMYDPHKSWTLLLRWGKGDWRIHDVLEKRDGKQVSVRERLSAAMH